MQPTCVHTAFVINITVIIIIIIRSSSTVVNIGLMPRLHLILVHVAQIQVVSTCSPFVTVYMYHVGLCVLLRLWACCVYTAGSGVFAFK